MRIEMVEGHYKHLSFFTSNLCTIHKTKRELVEDVYARQAGKLLYPGYSGEVEWEKHTFEVTCHTSKRAAKDIVVHGLGWVSITGFGSAVFDVYVAKGVGVGIREPLMPFEGLPERVLSTLGRTINSEKVARSK